MNRLSRWIVDGYRALARAYYHLRYRAVARQLGSLTEPSSGAPHDRRPGFIIIQLDGLSYDHLVQALAQGYAPHIKRLLASGQVRLAPWRCGLPSTTPAVQAGLMFGDNEDIPGFRWYEKERQRSLVCKWPGHARLIQSRLAARRPGILRGGSSYFNVLDGEAEWAVFTLSALRPPRLFSSVRSLGVLFLFLLSPRRILRIVGLTLWYYLKDLMRRLWAALQPGRSSYRLFDPLSPLFHIFINILFQEVQTFGVMLDIYRGAPAIYVNFTTYDEVAHQVGPTHKLAFQAIKQADRQIQRINRMRVHTTSRRYDLYILSDHGITPSVPFQERFGQRLGDYLREQIGDPLVLEETGEAHEQTLAKARYLADELQGLEERLSSRGAAIVRAARRYVNRRIPADWEHEGWDLARRRDVVVQDSGPLAHVYFNVTQDRLILSDIVLLYPRLLNNLLDHPGIGLVVGLEDGAVIVMGKGGTLSVRDGEVRRHGDDPLAGLADRDYLLEQIARLARFPHSGDLILFGAWLEDGRVISFENQRGTHGGIGGPQGYPFLIYPAEIGLALNHVRNATDLYTHFRRYRLPERVHPRSRPGSSVQ